MTAADRSWSLFVDAQVLQMPMHRERGIPRYATEWTRAMLGIEHAITAIAMNPLLERPGELHPEIATAPQLTWNSARALRRVVDGGAVIYHLLGPLAWGTIPMAQVPPHALESGVPIAALLYDLVPEIYPDGYLPGRVTRQIYFARVDFLRRCDLLLALSENTRTDAIERWRIDPDRVVTVGAGASSYFRPARPGEDPLRLAQSQIEDLQRPFVLAVTGWDHRKNTELLFDAWRMLDPGVRNDHQLVVVCSLPDEGRAAWTAYAGALGLRPDEYVLTGRVSEPTLRALYQAARLSVFPSRYEGFGLPVLEAARCACPSLVSNASSIPEILEDPTAEFSPDDPERLAAMLEEALDDDERLDALRARAAAAARRHTWERVAARSADAFDRLHAARSHRRRTRTWRPRIALLGPFPPAASGIADYNHQLASRLAEHATLHCFTETGVPEVELPEGYDLYPIESFARVLNPASYDLVLNTLGNGPNHVRTLEYATRYGGTAWLHDIDLAGLYVSVARRHYESTEARRAHLRAVLASYWERAPWRSLEEPDFEKRLVSDGAGVSFTADIVRHAERVIVSSELAARLLEVDVAPFGTLPPVEVLPLAFPDVVPTMRRTDEPPLVVVLGHVYPIKRPDAVLSAVAGLADASVRVAFVGYVPDDVREACEEHARSLGIAERVTFTGYAPRAEYESWLRRATCLVALRERSHGEASATATEAMAAGVPVITSVGACAELPADAIRYVPTTITPAELTEVLRSVIYDEGERERMSRRAREVAAGWTFDHVARRLAEIAASNHELGSGRIAS